MSREAASLFPHNDPPSVIESRNINLFYKFNNYTTYFKENKADVDNFTADTCRLFKVQ
jgi:hypothetical protein